MFCFQARSNYLTAILVLFFLSFTALVTTADELSLKEDLFEQTQEEGDLELELRLDQFLEENPELPAVGAVFRKDNQTLQMAASGVRRVGSPVRIQKEDKFHLASCTKAMTATLFAVLVEKEKISWTSTVEKVLGSKYPVHAGNQATTMEMLFAHRSGLMRNYPTSAWSEIKNNPQLSAREGRQLIARDLLKQTPQITPADKFQYSNSAYALAGAAMEEVMDQSWESMMREYIFEPLDMSSCGFGPPADDSLENILQPWGHQIGQGGVLTPVLPSRAAKAKPAATGAGGFVHCNMQDWLKFLQAHLDGHAGIDNIVTTESYKKLHTPYPKTDQIYTYGGWGSTTRRWAGGQALAHSGSNFNFSSQVWLGLNANIAMVAVGNSWSRELKFSSRVDPIFSYLLRNE